jgi:hypothetical protein
MQAIERKTQQGKATWLATSLDASTPEDIRAAALTRAFDAFRLADGDVKRAARIIGIDYTALYRLTRRYPELAKALQRARDLVGWVAR